MRKQTQRKDNSQSIIAKFWNEFLFAREFEYETPLTPDEMADVLQQFDGTHYKAWSWSPTSLVHKVTYERLGDKAGNFTIELVNGNNRGWGRKSAMQQVEGSITANPETGLSTIQGRTHFSARYYILFLCMFMFNFLAQSTDRSIIFQSVWIIIIIAFWYSMYRERNKLADRIDNLIMNAKSEQSAANLLDEDIDDEWFDSADMMHRESQSG